MMQFLIKGLLKLAITQEGRCQDAYSFYLMIDNKNNTLVGIINAAMQEASGP